MWGARLTGIIRTVVIWILVAVVLAMAVVRLAVGYPQPDARFVRLSRGEAALLAAAADAAFPGGGALPASGGDAGVPNWVDRLLEVSHPRTRRQMRMLFFLFEHATLVFPAPGLSGFRRFSSLGLEQRMAVFDAWEKSRLWQRRLVFSSLRALLTLGYFAHPPVLRALGLAPFDIPTPICEADLLYPRIGAHPSSIPLTRADLTPPSDGTPLSLDAPLHPRYAGDAS